MLVIETMEGESADSGACLYYCTRVFYLVIHPLQDTHVRSKMHLVGSKIFLSIAVEDLWIRPIEFYGTCGLMSPGL